MTATIGLSEELGAPFYTGTGTSTEVPGKWDVALNGRAFMLDTRYFFGGGGTAGGFGRDTKRSSIQLLKPQQDNSPLITERSLNPEDLVRQSQESWHHGAGQTFFDRDESDSARFRSSKGIDVLSERFRFQLLADTDKKSSSANTVMDQCVAGSRLYRIDGTTVEWTADITADTPTWTAVTGLPAGAPTSICTDGYVVYIACSANGIYSTNTGTSAASSFCSGTITLVAWVKGRLMAAGGSAIYNPTSSGAGPGSALNSTLSTGITWVRFAEGPGYIYAAGYSGTRSVVYKITIQPDATSLAAPSVAMTLPDGEIIRTIYGYQNYVLAGTSDGVWICKPDSNGNLVYNKIVEGVDCRCFDGQGHLVRFGWTNYDSDSTGLGRLDLSTDIDTREVLTPPYATDLMTTYGTTVQGAVIAVSTFQDRAVFCVSAAGWWAEDTNLVPTGTLRTGLITNGLADAKVAVWLTLSHEQLAGSIAAALATDGSETFTTLGSSVDSNATAKTLPVGEARAEVFELEFTLTRAAGATTGPKGTRWLLESNPAPGRGARLTFALLLYRKVKTKSGSETVDVKSAHDFLVSLEEAAAPVTCQTAWGVETVFVDDHDFLVDSYDSDGFQGTYLVYLRKPRRRST